MVWIGLEGCDGTGKSTLAEAVAEELRRRVRLGMIPYGEVELIHKSQPTKSVLEEYATDVEGREDTHLVFDRWHMGELVYSQLYRGTDEYGALGVAGLRWVEKFLQARGTRFFVVDQSYDVVAERLATRGEDYLQTHHVEFVLNRFRQLSYDSILTPADPVVVTNGLEHVKHAASMLVTEASMYANHAHALRQWPSYVGPAHPRVLLVGEKRGGKPPFESQACFMPLKNKSGELLWNTLPDPFWRRAGVVNAVEDDVPSLLKRFVVDTTVIALGAVASGILTDAGIDHGRVPHPQYIKRFLNKKQADYGALIERVFATGEQVATWPN